MVAKLMHLCGHRRLQNVNVGFENSFELHPGNFQVNSDIKSSIIKSSGQSAKFGPCQRESHL